MPSEREKKKGDKPDAGRTGQVKSRNRSALTKPATTLQSTAGDLIRLNRYIASSGICSRRQADELIKSGCITVNGKVVTELGTKVRPQDIVRYNGQRIKNEPFRYILLNKPKDYITTMRDPGQRKTVMELIRGACRERVYPVGRLDRNTTGLLLFTNDGDLARALMHPSSRIQKIYHIETDRPVSQQDLKKIAQGVMLEDGIARVDAVAYDHPELKTHIGLEIHQGRNRIVRRIFEKLGYRICKLDRVMYAGLTKKDLPRGRWRHLTEREVSWLKMQVGARLKTQRKEAERS
jgi:23S rRNA pseudouridine2605 synthase